jgi:predicted RNase H-like HicB family nuclease
VKAVIRDVQVEVMKYSARYVKIVEWSEEDQCYVGSAPGLFYGGCHGDDEGAVFAELCQIVEETIRLYREDNKQLPPATSGRDLANRLQEVA